MIRIKKSSEIELLREGGKILGAILDEIAKKIKPGIETAELEELACKLIAEAGGRPAFKNYEMSNGELFPTALITSINDEVVHAPAVPSRQLSAGDIVGIDLGMEYPINNGKTFKNKYSKLGGFYTDSAKTIAVGESDNQVSRLLTTTKECLYKGISMVKPGNTLNDIGTIIQKHAEANGFAVVRELVGHGVGHEAHEAPNVPNYKIANSIENAVLKPGMVIAIEPMVNMGGWKVKTKEDGFSIATADGSLSAHFEHTVLVTGSGHEILTQ